MTIKQNYDMKLDDFDQEEYKNFSIGTLMDMQRYNEELLQFLSYCEQLHSLLSLQIQFKDSARISPAKKFNLQQEINLTAKQAFNSLKAAEDLLYQIDGQSSFGSNPDEALRIFIHILSDPNDEESTIRREFINLCVEAALDVGRYMSIKEMDAEYPAFLGDIKS